MKKFNLLKEIIVADKNALLSAIDKGAPFAISIEGAIRYEPFKTSDIFIYKGAIAQKNLPLQDIFKNYKIVVDDDRVLIKASGAWNDIIGYNKENADYDDTSADGIGEYSDATLEEIGWYATDFDIDYREMTNYLEEACEGTLLCIETEEPYQFSGLGFFSDKEEARKKLYAFCKEKIAQKMRDDEDYNPENLTDDEKEAARYFTLL